MKKLYLIIISIIFLSFTNIYIPTGSMTTDKQIIYYSIQNKNGFGGYDIYKSERLANGDWGHSENLGNMINTPYDEINPIIDKDNATLYFNIIKNGDTLNCNATLSDEGFWRDVEITFKGNTLTNL